MLGREMVMPLQAVIGQPDKDESWEDEKDYVQSLKSKLQSIHELARKFLKERSQYQKKNMTVMLRSDWTGSVDP